MHYISHNLRYYRESNRLSQQEIADKLKTTLGRIKTYETGVATPQVEMLVAIADMIGVTIDALIRVKLNEKNFKQHPSGTMRDILKRLEKLESGMKK